MACSQHACPNSINCAKQLKVKQKHSERTLEAEILKLEHNFKNSSSEVEKNGIRKSLETKKQSLEQLTTYKTQGFFLVFTHVTCN